MLRRMFPCALAAFSILAAASFSRAQTTDEIRPRRTVAVSEDLGGISCLDPTIAYFGAAEESAPQHISRSEVKPGKRVVASQSVRESLDQLISAAIDERLGARYSWGSTGPFTFDCSGFVWSTFHSAGIDFERGSARALWDRFVPAAPEEEFKFGTLVFFSRLKHVGIVADEYGFYHASRHHGVIYSPFNEYWLSRIDGFRRVPTPQALTD